MSGIFGVWHPDGRPVQRDHVQSMDRALRHRGPDGGRIWVQGPLALGHRLLATTAEAVAERQPLGLHRESGRVRPAVSGQHDLVLVADARIDNREELRRQLRLAAAGFARVTDPELILRAWATWGDACLERLVGDFAFVLWDAFRHRLFCARDPLGIRVLYYHHLPGRSFFFATEPRALLAVPGLSGGLDELALALHVEGCLLDREITVHQGVRRLPPAGALVVGSRRCRTSTYWAVDPESELQLSSDADYEEAFREHFRGAVRARTRTATRVSAALSGGLDSSSIVSVARDLVPGDLLTLSAVFPGLPSDERRLADETEYIEAVVGAGRVESKRVATDRMSPLGGRDEVLRAQDAPHGGFNLYLHRPLFDLARENGARVFLDGIDGDSVVGHGLELIFALAHRGDWAGFSATVTALAERQGDPVAVLAGNFSRPQMERLAGTWRWTSYGRAAGVLRGLGVSRKALLRRFGRGVLRRGPFRVFGDGLLGGLRHRAPSSWIDPELASRTRVRERIQALGPTPREAFLPRKAHASLIANPVFQSAIEMLDCEAAARGVEPRYPFADRRLVEFCVSLPADQKLRDGWTRWILRAAMRDVLPPEVQWRRTKQDFTPAFVRGLRTHGADGLIRVLGRDSATLAGIAHRPTLDRALARLLSSGGGWKKVRRDAMVIFQAAILARWLESRASTVDDDLASGRI